MMTMTMTITIIHSNVCCCPLRIRPRHSRHFICTGAKQGVDFVAASFVRKASDVAMIREHLKSVGGEGIKIISKIENQEGLQNFDEILMESDAIMVSTHARASTHMHTCTNSFLRACIHKYRRLWMFSRAFMDAFESFWMLLINSYVGSAASLQVARGDLGVEIPVEKVALAQKMMISKCNLAGEQARETNRPPPPIIRVTLIPDTQSRQSTAKTLSLERRIANPRPETGNTEASTLHFCRQAGCDCYSDA